VPNTQKVGQGEVQGLRTKREKVSGYNVGECVKKVEYYMHDPDYLSHPDWVTVCTHKRISVWKYYFLILKGWMK